MCLAYTRLPQRPTLYLLIKETTHSAQLKKQNNEGNVTINPAVLLHTHSHIKTPTGD